MARGESPGKLNRGFSLIELTIALAIFSTGLGGFSLLLMLAIQESTTSRLQNLAVIQATSMVETMRLVPGAGTEFLSSTGVDSCLNGGLCTPGQMASAAFYDWQQGLAQKIPGSTGMLCYDSTPDDGHPDNPACDGSGALVVKVLWKEAGSHSEEATRVRRVVARLPLL